MSNTYTPNTKLAMPAIGDTGWAVPVNANCTLLDALSPVGGLAVTTTEVPSASLNVAVAAGTYIKQDGTIGSIRGPGSQAIGASSTQVLYLDLTNSGALAVAAAYPTTPHVRLATVVAGARHISFDHRQPPVLQRRGFVGRRRQHHAGHRDRNPDRRPRPTRSWGSSARPRRPSPRWAPRPPGPPTRVTSRRCSRPSTVPSVRWDWGVDMPGSFDLDNTTPAPLRRRAGGQRLPLQSGRGRSLLPLPQCPVPPDRLPRRPRAARGAVRVHHGRRARAQPRLAIQFEQVWPIDAQGPYVVNPDDRLVVMAPNPDGSPLILFDGFAQVPQVDVTPRSQRVTFTAVGVAVREWDSPISGRVQRHSDPVGLQDTSGDSDVQIDLPCRFNPSDTSVGSRGRLSAEPDPERRGYRPVAR